MDPHLLDALIGTGALALWVTAVIAIDNHRPAARRLCTCGHRKETHR